RNDGARRLAMRRIGFGILAFFVGVAALFTTQIGVTRLWATLGVLYGPGNLPISSMQQVAALSTVFTAVFVGSLVAARVSRRDAWWVLLAMGLVGVSIDGYVMLFKLKDDLPAWFRVCFVSLIPVATILAGYLSARFWPSSPANDDPA
ncbi:MAG: hypothetical protein QNI86_08790, partial [Halieaceae bacterium]|nr:hypothetical protein [Halieaceae bacterium]